MCYSSIYASSRTAKAKEHLVVRTIPNGHGHKGFYPADPKARNTRLVCIAPRGVNKTTPMVIRKLNFVPHLVERLPHAKYEGKRNVKIELISVGYDYFCLGNGKIQCGLNQLADGVRVDKGYPVRKRRPKVKLAAVSTTAGVAAVNKAIEEAWRTTPTPVKAGSTTKPGRKARAAVRAKA